MSPLSKNYPIGVFDSGLGGLTVVKALMRALPCEDIVYFGDTARLPYGTKSRESIIRFSRENAGLLLRHRVKMIVVACHSSSSHALATLKAKFPVPIIGVIDPGVKKAVNVTERKIVGVIATPSTINSKAYAKKMREADSSIKVVSQACPLFVPLVEEGWFNTRVTLMIARGYLNTIKKAQADTLILGCTHYPLLKSVLRKIMGPRVALVDSAREVAHEVKSLLNAKEMARAGRHKARYLFLISDEPEHFRSSARRFLGCDIKNVKRVS